MFIEFATPEGLRMVIKANRVQAFASTEEGTTRIFLGGALSCLVSEDADEVKRRLTMFDSNDGE